MSLEDNKAVARRFFEEFTDGNLDAVADLMHAEHVFHFPLLPGPVDKPAHVAGQAAVKAAFPDYAMEVTEQIAEEDMVFNRLRVTGTHVGEFMGRPGSGKTFAVATFNVMRISDGQVVDEWDEFDTVEFLTQLDIVEKP
ncbi:MAG: ester cyclase [Alphaproteobacteria bacterium]